MSETPDAEESNIPTENGVVETRGVAQVTKPATC